MSERSYTGPVIDCAVHYRWRSQLEVMPYLDAGWREYLGRPGLFPDGSGLVPMIPGFPFVDPQGKASTSLLDGPFEVSTAERQLVVHEQAMLAPAAPNPHLAQAICRAANDWTVEQLLEGDDDRLHSLVLVGNGLPDLAADEVRRVGEHPRMAGVLLGGNGGGRPFGHPAYHPIYAAAAELGLPIVLHVDGDGPIDTNTMPVAAGLPSTQVEYNVLRTTALMSHLVSFLVQGVFEKFPGLKLLIVGGGTAWLPSMMWRLDTNWRGHRREVPWVRREPTEYLREHVKLTTWPLERPLRPERLTALLEAFDGMSDLLCFASGAPDWNADDVDTVASKIPTEWHSKVFHDNADALLRWSPAARPRDAVSDVKVGDMPARGTGDELEDLAELAALDDLRGSFPTVD